MATFVTLLKYTQKGAESIKQAPARIDAARQAAKAAGAEIKQIYLVMGRYDAVVISEVLMTKPLPHSRWRPACKGTCTQRHCGPFRKRSSGG